MLQKIDIDSLTGGWIRAIQLVKESGKIPDNISDQPETSFEHIEKMVLYLKDNYLDMEETKAHRWMGYIQGVLSAYGILNVEKERNRTRPIFNARGVLETIDLTGEE